METKICKVCGRELPETEFKLTRWGSRSSTCNTCVQEKRAQMRHERAQVGGVNRHPFLTPTSTAKSRARSCN